MPDSGILVFIVLLALVFDFINGFHDTANAVATVISTRVLSPTLAILMVASLNLLGALSGTAVAKTIGSGIVGSSVSMDVILAALIAAIIWNLVTWYYGIPSSSSHALIGGLIGGGISSAGFDLVHWNVLLQKIVLPFILSPIAGFIGAFVVMRFMLIICSTLPHGRVNSLFRKFQLASSAFMAFSHGSNDAQKTMGIVTLALISAHKIPAEPFQVPLWVILLSALAMAAGTARGGWRIIKTMGLKLFTMTPIHGFVAETAAATVIETASRLGFPLSTTHIISSSIVGVGASHRVKSVHWDIVGNMTRAWILTIPISALIAFLCFKLTKLL